MPLGQEGGLADLPLFSSKTVHVPAAGLCGLMCPISCL